MEFRLILPCALILACQGGLLAAGISQYTLSIPGALLSAVCAFGIATGIHFSIKKNKGEPLSPTSEGEGEGEGEGERAKISFAAPLVAALDHLADEEEESGRCNLWMTNKAEDGRKFLTACTVCWAPWEVQALDLLGRHAPLPKAANGAPVDMEEWIQGTERVSVVTFRGRGPLVYVAIRRTNWWDPYGEQL